MTLIEKLGLVAAWTLCALIVWATFELHEAFLFLLMPASFAAGAYTDLVQQAEARRHRWRA